jgi:hypothetical protein
MSTVNSARYFMTLAELERNDSGPIWVMNTTHAPEAKIILGVLRRNGVGSDPLRIPKTFIPIDLTLQVPRTQIMESADFRRTVGGGLVKIVTPEYAELILNTEEGRAEQERVDNEMSRVRALVENEAISGDPVISSAERRASEVASAARNGRALDQAESNSETRAQKKRQQEGGSVPTSGAGSASLKIQLICVDFKEENWEPSKVVLEIKRYGEQKLTTADFKLLSSTFKEVPRVFAYLREVYKKRKADLK